MEVIQLLSKADRHLGRLDVFWVRKHRLIY
jgi:hypothetical protein